MSEVDPVRRTRLLLKNYPLLMMSLASYPDKRVDIMFGVGVGLVLAAKTRGRSPTDPTLHRVIALEEIDEGHATTLAVFRTVEKALKRLDRSSREMVELHFFEGLTVMAVAARLGVSVSTAQRKTWAFLNDLTERLSQYF